MTLFVGAHTMPRHSPAAQLPDGDLSMKIK
jgi:hypothetical protein